MIEAPEALYLCEQLNKTVKGKRITNVFTLFTPHKFAWFSGSPDEYAEWLTGK
jgi:formamidopyrimidine-DNA glycosylase